MKKRILLVLFIGCITTASLANSKKENLIARIIFSESGPNKQDRFLIASVIKNRIKHPGFDLGKLKDMNDVIHQPGAFASLNDKKNKNWTLSKTPGRMTKLEKQIWQDCIRLSKRKFTPHKKIVYFHNKKISMPKTWDNKWWTPIKETGTNWHIFYSVRKK